MKDFYDKYVSPKVESALEKYEEKKQTVLIILAVIGVVLLTACIAAFASIGARAELASVGLETGDNAVPTPCRAMMIHEISTNASGTVALKKATSFSFAWIDW